MEGGSGEREHTSDVMEIKNGYRVVVKDEVVDDDVRRSADMVTARAVAHREGCREHCEDLLFGVWLWKDQNYR